MQEIIVYSLISASVLYLIYHFLLRKKPESCDKCQPSTPPKKQETA